ncbi:Radical SAM domain protein [Desulfamplus magnetovallimortis]|uniref:Radical SAM domain protein n=1 Tax=Desulfamplus magnetovallimortis TaxID=1246637 RepID=A0A1W1HET6_9BACT|nr:radical SAM protein [Desulfamplus magnetovallimortis]SLM30980.1 Radical SAM domain protein [Desulfamplus magnetovallimortis]
MSLLYTKYKIFHYTDKINSLPETSNEILAPIHVRIKPTNICNHRCRYCAYRKDNLQLGQDMAIRDTIPCAKMLEIVDDLSEMGVKAITFSGGGDPLCYPDIIPTLKRLMETSIQFATLTNGARLQGEIAELFAHYGTWIRISMDGWDDASYKYYRRAGANEYSKIINNMREFKKLDGKCYLGVSLIIDNYNHDKIFDSIQRLSDIGVDSVKISPCIISNKGKENNEYHKPLFKQVKRDIQRARQKFETQNFQIYDAYHELDDKFNKPYEWCPYQQILPVIGADLNVYPCQDKAYNLKASLGSIAQKRFTDFWFEKKKRFFYIKPSKECSHHCVANEKNQIILEYLDADKEHICFV